MRGKCRNSKTTITATSRNLFVPFEKSTFFMGAYAVSHKHKKKNTHKYKKKLKMRSAIVSIGVPIIPLAAHASARTLRRHLAILLDDIKANKFHLGSHELDTFKCILTLSLSPSLALFPLRLRRSTTKQLSSHCKYLSRVVYVWKPFDLSTVFSRAFSRITSPRIFVHRYLMILVLCAVI